MKTYRNAAEQAFAQFAREQGWSVSKRGWPDFFCWADGRIALVEVKRHKNYRLRTGQYRLMKALSERGVPVFRWSPDEGLREIIFEDEKPGFL